MFGNISGWKIEVFSKNFKPNFIWKYDLFWDITAFKTHLCVLWISRPWKWSVLSKVDRNYICSYHKIRCQLEIRAVLRYIDVMEIPSRMTSAGKQGHRFKNTSCWLLQLEIISILILNLDPAPSWKFPQKWCQLAKKNTCFMNTSRWLFLIKCSPFFPITKLNA